MLLTGEEREVNPFLQNLAYETRDHLNTPKVIINTRSVQCDIDSIII